jgi:hypothetical protein
MADIVVRTDVCTLRLDRVSGDLRGIAWHDPALTVIREPRLGENFRLLLPLPEREGVYFNSRDQAVTRVEPDPSGVTCIYDGLRNESEEVNVRVVYRIECAGDGLEFSVTVDNHTDRPLAEVLFGVLGGVRGVGPRAGTKSVVPGPHVNLAPDIFHTFPEGSYGGGNLGIRHSASAFVYPGDESMSMSWASLYNERTGLGLYYGSHDPEPRLAALYMELRPFSTSAVRGSNWPSRRVLPKGEPVGVTMGWMNFPHTRRSSVELGPVRVQVHRGDWREGSAIYRRWYDAHFPIGEKTSWLRREMAWQSTIMANPEGVTVHRFADLPEMAADAAKYDVTTFEMCGWDVGGIDRGYPEYRPDPALGTREDFRAALQGIRDEGVNPVIFANLQFADTATEHYRDELHRYALRGRWAEDLRLLGWGEGTVSARLGLARSNMAILSLSHPELRKLLVDQMLDLVRDGAAALQLDKAWAIEYLDFNERVPTSPDRSAPEGLLTTLREILAGGREIDPEFTLACETWWDRAFPLVDVLYSRMVDVDMPHPALVFTFPEVVSTIFAENPADYNVMNNGMRYGMVWALAPRHYHDSLDERLTRPLARYVQELIRIRSKHRDILFHGRFRDTLGAVVEPHTDLRHSVFRADDSDEAPRACVLVNYGNRPIETSVEWSPPARGRVEICQPHRPDRTATLPATIDLPPQTCAVVVESRAGA